MRGGRVTDVATSGQQRKERGKENRRERGGCFAMPDAAGARHRQYVFARLLRKICSTAAIFNRPKRDIWAGDMWHCYSKLASGGRWRWFRIFDGVLFMGTKNELWIGKRRSVRSFVTRAGREGKVTARDMLPRFLLSSSSSSSSVASSGMRDKYVPARSLINGICLARCAFSPSLALASPTPFCCRCHAKTSPRGTEMGSSWQKCSSGFFCSFATRGWEGWRPPAKVGRIGSEDLKNPKIH